MKFFGAIVIYLILTVAILQSWWVLVGACFLLFSWWSNTVFLIPLAVLLDGYFGNFHHVPVFSLLAVGWYLVVESIKPRLRAMGQSLHYE